nr:N-acetylmuramoyl-L-alanine amidase [Deltaproteobacteria bacterium]
MRDLRIAVVMAMGACTAATDAELPVATVQHELEAAAAEANVPADLMIAIAIEERGLKRPAWRNVEDHDHVPVAGMLELRHGRLDTLALGASLLGTNEYALRVDTKLGTRAGAHVLAHLGARNNTTDDLASWRPALEELSGMADAEARAYASRVFSILRTGGEFAARDGERVMLAHHDLVEEPTTSHANGISDYPAAEWIWTSCDDKCTIGRPYGNDSVDKILIHDTEGNWNASVATLQHDPGKSVHYINDADGSRIGQFRPETDTTWHGGNFFYNATSIGIEHVGVAADPNGYSTELYAASRALVEDIRTRWSVPLDRQHIIGHYQIPDGT